MSKEMAVIVLGVWVAILPHLGIPGSWRTALFVLSGMALVGVGFFLRGESLTRARSEEHQDVRARPHRKPAYPFVENSALADAPPPPEASQPKPHTPPPPEAPPARAPRRTRASNHAHEQKEGITSLN